MHIRECLKQLKDKKVKIFVDMDGVIADYIVGAPSDYDKKRPLYDNIYVLNEISNMPNVEMFILSATRKSTGLSEKNWWLDNVAPFFKSENRVILSREDNDMKTSALLKAEYLANYERDGSVLILIDDDPAILKEVGKQNDDVVLLKDTTLIGSDAVELREHLNVNSGLFVDFCNASPELAWKKRSHHGFEHIHFPGEVFTTGISFNGEELVQILDMEYWDKLDVAVIQNNNDKGREKIYGQY